MIEKIVISEFVHTCGIVPMPNYWAGVFTCNQPTLNLVTGIDKRNQEYKQYPVCDDCIKEYFDES